MTSGEIRYIVAVAFALLSQGTMGQIAADHPHFDAASVRMIAKEDVPHQPRVSLREDSGRIDYRMVGIRQLVLKAFQRPDYQVVWPKWVADFGRSSYVDRYDVTATMSAGTVESQMRLMLQGLLAERFKLAAHLEMKPVPVYAVVVSKNGLRIQKVPDPPDDTYMGPMYSAAGWHIDGKYTIGRFLGFFFGELDRPLLDMTGLQGYYHFDLVWDRAPQVGRGPAATAGGDGAPATDTPAGGDETSLFSAMNKRLGLNVEKRLVPTELLVIDHLERVPSEN